MEDLTKKQDAVRKFIVSELRAGRPCPTHREIASHFGFASSYAAACHVKALITERHFDCRTRQSPRFTLGRSVSRRAPPGSLPKFRCSVPSLPDLPRTKNQEPDGCVVVDISSIGFKPTRNTFCVRVVGDSMTGRFICDGDIVILEHGQEPRNGEIVAALIDRKTTLKTFVERGSKRFSKRKIRNTRIWFRPKNW